MKPIVVPVTLLLLLTTPTDFAQTANNARASPPIVAG
jgi:hypothetical protein